VFAPQAAPRAAVLINSATADPRAIGARSIGHFGFFRSEHRDTLWRDAAAWLAGSAS
jgi:predicted alpha/beta hydrolase